MSKSFVHTSAATPETLNQGANFTIYPMGSFEGDSGVKGVAISADCKIRKIGLRIDANTLSGSITLRLYVNGILTPYEHVIASGTGVYYDEENAYQLFADDEFVFVAEAESGTGSADIDQLMFEMEPDASGDCISFFGCNTSGSSAMSSASTNYYGTLTGLRDISQTEANLDRRIPIAGTAKYLYHRGGTNTRSDATPITLRINGSAGNQTLTVSAGTSGDSQSDTSNTDTIAANDLVNIEAVLGAGTGTHNIEKIGLQLVNTSDLAFLSAGSGAGGGNTISASSSGYLSPVGSVTGLIATEADAQIEALDDMDVSAIYNKLYTNGVTNGTTFTLRVNGSDTALSNSISGGSTAYGSDTGTVSISKGDLYCYSVSVGSGGTDVKIEDVGMVYTVTGTNGAATGGIEPYLRQSNNQFQGTNVTSYTATFDNPPRKGSLLVARFTVRNGTDSDSFTLDSDWTELSDGYATDDGYIWAYRVATGAAADEGCELSWTDSGRVQSRLEEWEWDALDSTTPLDGSNEDETNINASGNKAQQTGSVTPTTTDGIAFAFCGAGQSTGQWDTGFNTGNISIDSSFTLVASLCLSNVRPFVAAAHKRITTTTALNPTFTTTDATGGPSYGALAVFKAADAGWSVTDVDLDESIYDGQTGVVVTITGTVAATGKKCWITQGANTVEQTVTGQTATTVTITVDYGGVLAPGAATLKIGNPL